MCFIPFFLVACFSSSTDSSADMATKAKEAVCSCKLISSAVVPGHSPLMGSSSPRCALSHRQGESVARCGLGQNHHLPLRRMIQTCVLVQMGDKWHPTYELRVVNCIKNQLTCSSYLISDRLLSLSGPHLTNNMT